MTPKEIGTEVHHCYEVACAWTLAHGGDLGSPCSTSLVQIERAKARAEGYAAGVAAERAFRSQDRTHQSAQRVRWAILRSDCARVINARDLAAAAVDALEGE